MPSTVIYLLATPLLYIFLRTLLQHHRLSTLSAKHGYVPPPSVPSPDGPLGISELINLQKSRSQNQFLEYVRQRFKDVSEKVSLEEGRKAAVNVNNVNVKTYRFRILGQEMVMSKDPEVLKWINAERFGEWDRGEVQCGSFAPLLGSSILSTDGAVWAHHRSMLRPHLQRDQVGDLALNERNMQVLMRAVPTSPSNSPSTEKNSKWTKPTNLQHLFERFTMDASTEYFFGHNVHSQLASLSATDPSKLDSKGQKAELEFVHAIEQSLLCVADCIMMAGMYKWGISKKYLGYCRTVHGYVDGIIQGKMDGQKKREDIEKDGVDGDMENKQAKPVLLESLLAETANDTLAVRGEMLAILLAGRDTTAALLSFLFLTLYQHPVTFNTLRTRILHDFGPYTSSTTSITFSTLKSCNPLQNTLLETLRLYPIFPLAVREANTDTYIPRGGGNGGDKPFFVGKGTQVMFSVDAMQRDAKIWGVDAEEFRPERWEGRRRGWEFGAFGGGNRICIGQQLALTKAAYVTVRLLQRFDKIELGTPETTVEYPIKNFMTTGIMPLEGCTLRLREASS